MAIQTRRGNYADFDPSKMVPGEWASVVQGDPNADDGRAVYMCFAAGDVKRMATYEDMVSNIEEATSEIQEAFTEGVETATQNANNATAAANEIVEEVEQKLEDGDFVGAKGDTGNGINSAAVTVEYQASGSGTAIPTGTWSTTIPEVAAGSYLWTRITIPYTDGNSTVSYSVAKMGDTGPAGTVSVDTDAVVTYDTPEEYTPPASGNTLATWLGRVTRGLSNLFSSVSSLTSGLAQKLNASQVLSEEEWDAGTVSERGYLADAKDILDEFAQLNTDLEAGIANWNQRIRDTSTNDVFQSIQNQWSVLPRGFCGVMKVGTSTASVAATALTYKHSSMEYGAVLIISHVYTEPEYHYLYNGTWN